MFEQTTFSQQYYKKVIVIEELLGGAFIHVAKLNILETHHDTLLDFVVIIRRRGGVPLDEKPAKQMKTSVSFIA